MRKKKIWITLLAGITLVATSVSASAEVLFTSESAGDADTVYVAGNPDFYPVEYYNVETESYEGILPEVLKIVSEKSGKSFTYICSGRVDRRERLAKNKQVEMISAYCPEEENMSEFLSGEQVVLSVPIDGKEQQICLGFTQIASEDLTEAVCSAVEDISDSELTELAVSCAKEQKEGQFPKWVLWAVVLLCILLFILSIFLSVKLYKNKKRGEQDKMLDPVTGIGNKVYFTHYFDNSISDNARILYYVAYLGFDIEYCNKYYGKEESENILRYAADVLTQNAADTDIVARITGGGFAVAFQSSNTEEAQERTRQLLEHLNSYGKKYSRDYEINFSAGVYSLEQSDRSCETVLFNAQQGYLHAVEKGLSFSFSNESLLQKTEEEAELQKQITAAFKNREFKMYMQFIVDKTTKEIFGAEALSRWQHPQKGLLLPGHYIGIMEELGSIKELDFYIFEEVCRQLENWSSTRFASLILSCNFTRLTISDDDFMARITEISSRYSFDHSRLIIEITEDIEAKNKENVVHNIIECKKAGFLIALDDFGDGYTSFSNLCDYHFDYIKIDKKILYGADTPNGKKLLDGMISMGHSMNMKVICEGIETQQQNELICNTECDFIQGFYYHRVIPQEETPEILKKVL